MVSKQWIIFGTFMLITVVRCEHIIKKRDLELPQKGGTPEISRQRALHEKVTQKRSGDHKEQYRVAHFASESPDSKLSRILTRNVLLHRNNKSPVFSRNLKHTTAVQRRLKVQHLKKNHPSSKLSSDRFAKGQINTGKKSRTPFQKKYKKYVIPNALFAWKQRQQPLYFTPRVFFNNPGQPKATIDAQRYYGYQPGKNLGLSNAAGVAAWQAYQKGGTRKMTPNIRLVGNKAQLPLFSKKPYGLVFGSVPPAGLGRLPQNQQGHNQGPSKVFTNGSRVSKVSKPLNQAEMTTLTVKGQAQRSKPKMFDVAPLKGKEEKNESKNVGKRRGQMRKKINRVHNKNASQRNLINSKEGGHHTGDNEDSKETSMNKQEEDSAYTNNEEKGEDESDNTNEASESQENVDKSYSEEDNNEADSDYSNGTNNDDESKDDASGVSRSSIEQDQDTESQENGDETESEESEDGNKGKVHEDTDNQEDGIQEGENSESEIFPSPEEAPQYAQDIDGPVDPANSPARDTGDDSTPPAPEETFTSRSMIDDIVPN